MKMKISLLVNAYLLTFSNKSNKSEDIERLLSISTNENDTQLSNETSYTTSINSGKSYNSKKSDSDILSYDLEVLNESWYQPNLPRESVQNYLLNQEIGSFVIRLSNSCVSCFALSIRVPYFANQNGIAHYLITKNTNGYKLKGVEKEFKSLKSLVTHYSVMQEILPVTLNLPLVINNRSINMTHKNNLIFDSNQMHSNASCFIK